MRFVNWWPDPRFVHIADWEVGSKGGLSRWSSLRGVDLTTKGDSFAFMASPAFEAPAGRRLNLVATVQVSEGAEPNLSWGYLLMLHDGSRPGSDKSGIVARITDVSDDHQSVRFTVPASGRLKLQGVAPEEPGGRLKVSQLSIVSDEGLAWMREHDEWWIHSQLMPLRSS